MDDLGVKFHLVLKLQSKAHKQIALVLYLFTLFPYK